MKEIVAGLYEVEEGDKDFDAINKTIEGVVAAQRKRLDAEAEYPWWTDAVFYVHDLVSFTHVMRTQGLGAIADAIIEATTLTGKKMIGLALAGVNNREDVVDELWLKLLLETQKLDAVLQKEIRAENGEKDH